MGEKDLLHSTEGIGGNENISMNDLLNSIDAEKYAANNDSQNKKKESSNTGKLRKQMKALKKEADRVPVLDKPMPSRKKQKLM